MASGLQLNLNRVIGRTDPSTFLEAQGAANVWAGTSGLDLLGALNAKAGTVGLGLNAVCDLLSSTSTLDADGASEYFGLLGNPNFANISAWYDGAAVNGVGVSNPADTDIITTWKDISGNGRDVTQSNNSLRPVFDASTINGKPSVWFNNNTDSMASTVAAPLVANKSVYAVVHRISSGVGTPQSIYMQRNPSSSSYGPQLRLTGPGAANATTVDYRVSTNPDLSTVTSSTTVANGTTNVLSMISDGSGSVVTSIKGYINGTLRGSTTGSGNLTDTSNVITLGSGTIAGPATHHSVYGYFATILTYDITHTDAERQSIERWLGSRYNITVA